MDKRIKKLARKAGLTWDKKTQNWKGKIDVELFAQLVSEDIYQGIATDDVEHGPRWWYAHRVAVIAGLDKDE